MRLGLKVEILMNLTTEHFGHNRLRKSKLQLDKKSLILNLLGVIFRFDNTNQMIRFREITCRNHTINNKSLQFVWFNYWFNILSHVQVIWIIKLFSYESRERRRSHEKSTKQSIKNSASKKHEYEGRQRRNRQLKKTDEHT